MFDDFGQGAVSGHAVRLHFAADPASAVLVVSVGGAAYLRLRSIENEALVALVHHLAV